MRSSFFFPSKTTLEKFLNAQRSKYFSYKQLGESKMGSPEHFDLDYHFVQLGKGDLVWEKARAALIKWDHFPQYWTQIYDPHPMIKRGNTVAVLFRIFGLWWINSARIVYTFDDPDRFGFAYGTLPGHLERGEECFWIERDRDDTISYHIRAFSKPAHWLIWMAYPMARFFQKQFVNDSMARMKEHCKIKKIKENAWSAKED